MDNKKFSDYFKKHHFILFSFIFFCGFMWGKYFYYGQESELTKAFKKKELKLLLQENFLPDDVLEAYYMDSGIQIIVETYDDSKELFSLLENNQYDVVSFKSENLKEILESRQLEKMNGLLIQNKENISADFLSSPVDREAQFSLPIYWGVTGLLSAGLDFILPKEGATLWTENVGIHNKSINQKIAHNFIDFLLQKEIALELLKFRNQSMTNKLLESDNTVNSQLKPSYLRKISISKLKYKL